MLTVQGGEQWFCTLDQGISFFAKVGLKIMFVGEKLHVTGLQAEFDDCLLTGPEMRKWERIMRSKRSADAIRTSLMRLSKVRGHPVHVSVARTSSANP